jgi:hypothetical protein
MREKPLASRRQSGQKQDPGPASPYYKATYRPLLSPYRDFANSIRWFSGMVSARTANSASTITSDYEPGRVVLRQGSGFTHEKPRAERDGRPQNRASSPALRGASVSEPECVFATRAELLKRSHA